MSMLTVDFCGEVHTLSPGQELSFGREADLVVDEDNGFLHRRTGCFVHETGFWWVVNTGARIALTISGEGGTLQSWVGPGGRLPLVLPRVAILFTAGETTYELLVVNDEQEQGFTAAGPIAELDGEVTKGAVDLTGSQFLLLVALCREALRRPGQGVIQLPTNAEAAELLGWPLTTFNRKLDNVCDKFDRAGVKGLRGGRGRLATSRRARLVEYVVAARIVQPHHLRLLELRLEGQR